MSKASRFKGRSAEKQFSTLCSLQEVTCNPASEDDHGWDHIVEFDHEPEGRLPADLQRCLPPMFVQTKTHEGSKPRMRMKLSNALALARSSNPCFMILRYRRRAGDKAEWFARHFWEEAIAQTLKRVREASRDGISEKAFNKHYITFNFGEADAHSDKELLGCLKSAVEVAGGDYAASKKAHFDNVGFGEERLVGTIEFAPMKSIEELIDHQLGLTPTIPIKRFELVNRRFGIDVKMPMPEAAGEILATVHAHPAAECQVRLRTPDGALIEMLGDLIASGLPGLPLEQCKVRVRTKLLDIVLSLGSATTFKMNYDTSDRMHLQELEGLVRLMSFAGQGAIDSQIWSDDRKLFGGTLTIDDRRDRDAYQRLTELVSVLKQLSGHLRIKRPKISIEDLASSEEQLCVLRDFLAAPTLNAGVTVESSTIPIHEVDHAALYAFANVGGWRFGALTRWRIAEQSLAGTRWSLKFDKPKIIETYAFELSDDSAASVFQADLDRSIKEPGALVLNSDVVETLMRPGRTISFNTMPTAPQRS